MHVPNALLSLTISIFEQRWMTSPQSTAIFHSAIEEVNEELRKSGRID